MKWLDRLKKQEQALAEATKPTNPNNVGFVANDSRDLQKLAPVDFVEDKKIGKLDSDNYCWPNSNAMNTAEIELFLRREDSFIDKGLSKQEAERISDRLVSRDRERDDRSFCIECVHLRGISRWQCDNQVKADLNTQDLAKNFVLILQRCAGFARSIQTK